MSKQFIFAMVITAGLVGGGAQVAAEGENPSATATPAIVDPGGSFTVVYTPCPTDEFVVYEFTGEPQRLACPISESEGPGDDFGDQGGLTVSGLFSPIATFTAPSTPGTYFGIAYVGSDDRLVQGIRRTDAPTLAQGGRRVGQALNCGNQPFCVQFSVTVRQATTTTTTTTTIAPTTTAAPATTAAPTTTAVAAVPPVPTTTIVTPSLPATGPSQNDNTATIAVVLLVVGAALLMAARWRGNARPT